MLRCDAYPMDDMRLDTDAENSAPPNQAEMQGGTEKANTNDLMQLGKNLWTSALASSLRRLSPGSRIPRWWSSIPYEATPRSVYYHRGFVDHDRTTTRENVLLRQQMYASM